MKNIILLLIIVCCSFSSHAQSGITKEKITGYWVIAAMDAPGMFYYSVEKDSLAVSDSVKKGAAKNGIDVSTLKAQMKQQTAFISNFSFSFDANGKAVIAVAISREESTYTVDEVKSIITTVEKEGKPQIYKAEMLGDRLKLRLPEEQEIWVILKKVGR